VIKPYIDHELRCGQRAQGSELTASDVGRTLALGWGRVTPGDVRKRVWLRDYGLVMENNEQRDNRLEATS
jgi:hypothetical protein